MVMCGLRLNHMQLPASLVSFIFVIQVCPFRLGYMAIPVRWPYSFYSAARSCALYLTKKDCFKATLNLHITKDYKSCTYQNFL